ncbi:MAG: hypothetical protein NT139_00110, partial [Candidatus Woesearchaeota archaeon]|nr:hypothetical protein [Candidatus Woesearchaeota archaeon]
LILNAILIYLITKRKESFLLWAFSPIVWYMAPFVSPILPVSFLFLLAYHTLKKYEENNKIINFVISSLSLGIACSLWSAAIYLTIFFLIAFFYDKKLLQFVLYLIPLIIGFSIRLLIDYTYLGFPFFSLITGLGSNLIHIFSKSSLTYEYYFQIPSFLSVSYLILLFLSLLIISVLISYKIYKLIKLHKMKEFWRENKKELLFLIPTSILFLYPPNFQFRYLLIITPFIIIFLSKSINKKELIIHIIISLIVIGVLTFPYFTNQQDKLTEQDLNQIAKEYPNQSFIAGNSNYQYAFIFSTLYWNKGIKEFISFDDYNLSQQNESIFSRYELETKPKMNILKKIKLTFLYERTDNRTYNDIKYLIIPKTEESIDIEVIEVNNLKILHPKIKIPPPPKEFKLIKEYNILDLYKKE